MYVDTVGTTNFKNCVFSTQVFWIQVYPACKTSFCFCFFYNL